MIHRPSPPSIIPALRPAGLRTLHSRSRGFTLIELLTVIAIIGILAAILIPSLGKIRESAAKTACASNLHQIAIATLAYASDNRGALPPHGGSYPFPHSLRSTRAVESQPSEWEQFKPYVGDASKAGLMYCPGALQDWRGPNNPNNTEYSPEDGNYITYSYFAYIPLTVTARTAFDLTSQDVLKNSKILPSNFGLWTCLTYRNGGRYHGHSDPDTTQPVQGQNAAYADGSVRWIKGADLIPYATIDSTFYGPRPRT